MRSPVLILAGVAMGMATPSEAAKVFAPTQIALNVSLGCAIENQKVLAVTNTSGASIPAGTHISYRFQRNPDHSVISGYLSGGTIAPGQVIKKGIVPAYSCQAWFRRQPVAAQ